MAFGIADRIRGWPRPEYQSDPVRFAKEVLGITPWDKQIEILEAVSKPRARVAVSSGHKIGKSNTAAILALWFYCSFPDARVIMTCVTARQVDEILYREVQKLHHASLRLNGTPIDGEVGGHANTGIRSKDFRQIVGFTARQVEAVAGISGANMLYLIDEASGVSDEIFEAIEGNRAAGARLAMFSNPTICSGEFFNAFESKQDVYTAKIRVSSEDTPNVKEGREVIPGLASREWIEEKKKEWGEKSPQYRIRIKGEHVKEEEGKIVSLHQLILAEARRADTKAEGRLYIGVDPAGPANEGDESAFAWTRGFLQIGLYAKQGMTAQDQLAQILSIIRENWKKREPIPVVKIDGLGKSGAELAGTLRVYLQEHPGAFELVIVRGSDNATREPQTYLRTRDEVWASLGKWVESGGVPLPDIKLQQEMNCPSWEGSLRGQLQATDKREMRKTLGRSPDRADALSLAVWEPIRYARRGHEAEAPAAISHQSYEASDLQGDAGKTFDAYGGAG